MDVNYDDEVLKNTTQCLEIIPVNVYIPKVDLKRKIYNIVKRGIDIIAGIFGVILMVPITIGIYIAQRLINDKGTIFYKQKRIGKNRQIFFYLEISYNDSIS